MTNAIDLTGQVALVTGAGSGLGRAHAIELGRRGAKIVVNDLGTSLKGEGKSSEAALSVVREIETAGGTAIANTGSVGSLADMNSLVEQALDAFGRLDIVVANAGILRDSSFKKCPIEDFELVVDIHLMGTARVVKAAWETLCTASYGRIIFTTSIAGLYGNFGQANYSTAKTGLIGLMNTLNLEGSKYNVRVNCISPFAATRMSEAHIPEDVLDLMDPRIVAAAVAYLASEGAPTGAILNAGAGFLSSTCIVDTAPTVLARGHTEAEDVARAWPTLSDLSQATQFNSAADYSADMLERVRGAQKS